MPEKGDTFVAPAAVDSKDDIGNQTQRLTNEDFRKLFMTPRSSSGMSTPSLSIPRDLGGVGGRVGGGAMSGGLGGSMSGVVGSGSSGTGKDADSEDRAERRRKKKSFYAKLKKQEEDKMAELALKYRDRARERREGANPDYQADDPMATAGGYRAVAPDVKSGMDAAERRRQMIQESKFLGGDMEHTHLVKGLDYALLQKVRSEIQTKEKEEEEEIEKFTQHKPKEKKDEVEDMQFKTKLGRTIYRSVFKSQEMERNELFAPGRMAYVIDLDDEYAESDIPTTLIRSKLDVPSPESQATLTTNDIVINKLAQILSYLRQGTRGSKKGKKKEKGPPPAANKEPVKEPKEERRVEESIYGEIGDYVPTSTRKRERAEKRTSYFEKPSAEEEEDDAFQEAWAAGTELAGEALKLEKREGRVEKEDRTLGALLKRDDGRNLSKAQKLLKKISAAEPEGYAECYPGFEEMHDAIEDSDDEVDYTKMDMGNKKGPIGRWDFDTQEEYSEYMNNKEALPKAAFQYGVKMADGRRTRKFPKEKNERAELDREWQKIQAIIQKRKASGGGGGGESERKVAKY